MLNIGIIDFGDVKPLGWLKDQMENDILNGFVGNLPNLVPSIMVEDDIYGENRLTKKMKIKNLGVVEDDVEGSLQLQWWNSESQSNWLDGYIRHAFLLNNKKLISKSKDYVYKKIETQEEDGYIGIYDNDMRYNFSFESGELWAQTTLFRALLGYYEASKDAIVLESVKMAVDRTMRGYPIYKSRPFTFEQTHGLTFSDILYQLFRYYNDIKYLEYASWLYKNFSYEDVNEYDAQESKLKLKNKLFSCHGVHTYEHLRALIINDKYEQSVESREKLEKSLARVRLVITPSGAPIGDEWIYEKIADPDKTGYEYCSIQELFHSLVMLYEHTGKVEYIDLAETLFFNSAQGSRFYKKSAIAYLNSDSVYEMSGEFQYKVKSAHKVQTRYKYSSVHQDVAVCCVPMAGRITPYYYWFSWMRSDEGLIKTLYGDSFIDTIYNNKKVKIKEVSNYPINSKITYFIESETEILLRYRIPKWSNEFYVENIDYVVDNNYIVIKIKEGLFQFNIVFKSKIIEGRDFQGRKFFRVGPLIYSLSIPGKIIEKDVYNNNKLPDYYIKETDISWREVKLSKEPELSNDFENAKNMEDLHLRTEIIRNNKKEEVFLIPMAVTNLRKVTF